jgi:UDP-4-amino-4,6-dideoxy-N-acetyl-beta-L-altrosamine N-acetyltransferase
MSELVDSQSRIRSMVYSDLELVLSWRNHPDVRNFMLTQHAITPDEHLRWFASAKSDKKRHLLIFEFASKPYGFVHFNETYINGVAEWGFYAKPGATKGSSRKLGSAALMHAFRELKFHKVCGQVLEYNERSINFHLSLGFQQEGILRDQHFNGDRYQHIYCFGLLSSEWNFVK